MVIVASRALPHLSDNGRALVVGLPRVERVAYVLHTADAVKHVIACMDASTETRLRLRSDLDVTGV